MTETAKGPHGTRLALACVGAAALVALAAWWVFGGDGVDRSKVYRIGYGDDVPFHFKGPDGMPSGVAVELVREAARREHIQLEWVAASGFGQRKLDLWVLMTVRPERARDLHITTPYLQTETCFIVLANGPVRSVADLAAARISYLDYAIHRDNLADALPHLKPLPVNSSREALEKVVSGQADAAYLDEYAALPSLLAGGFQAPMRILPSHTPKGRMGIASVFASARVADVIRDGMKSMVLDGSMSRTIEKWGLFPNLTSDMIDGMLSEQRKVRALWAGVFVLGAGVSIGLWLVTKLRRQARRLHRALGELRGAIGQLEDAEQKYRVLVENAVEGILVVQDGKIAFANARSCQMLECERETLVSRPMQEFLHPADRELVLERYRQRVRGETVTPRYELRMLSATGRVVWVDLNVVLIEWKGAPATLTFGSDITDRKWAEEERGKLQAQLGQALKMESVGRLAGGVAHDFNNMLQVIICNATLALEDVPPGSPARESLEEIQKSAQRSAELTRQLLAFARKQAVAPRVLDLNEVIAATLKMLRRLIGEHIKLIWLPGPNLWPVRMDPSQLDQILANLCVNARDAIADSGQIAIETQNATIDHEFAASHADCQPGDYVLLTVSDTGHGMDAETLSHVFEPFFTTKEIGRGTGLGLATVFGIVKQNLGLVYVRSESGRGTTFQLYLPRGEGVPTPAVDVAPAIGGAETILLVEDDEQILKLGKRILGERGYAVLTALSPHAALELTLRHAGPIHLLVTDIVMPGMNGRELRERLTVSRPALKCLFMSGYTADIIGHHGVLEGDVEFLQKPFSIEALAEKVRLVLDSALHK